jgi:hypothetical protein
MKHISRFLAFGFLAAAATAFGQRQVPTPQQAMANQFANIHTKILTMVKDFPEAKFSYRPTPEVRTFQEVVVHALSAMAYGANASKDHDANYEELDAKKFKSKAEVVAAFEKSMKDGTEALQSTPDASWAKTLFPWPFVIEHAGEQYGTLVVYYRLNGLVPPASRPKN